VGQAVSKQNISGRQYPLKWTQLGCDECGKECDVAVEIGEKPSYESNTAVLCRDCLDDAIKQWDKGLKL
jgi:hypothetical protein